jgi:putative flippase GtrA
MTSTLRPAPAAATAPAPASAPAAPAIGPHLRPAAEPDAPVLDVVVLIPVLEPGAALAEVVVPLLHAPLRGVLVVDDGSGPGPEGSYDALLTALEAAGAHVLRHPVNRGKGAALRSGMRAISRLAPGAAIVTADGDGQHLPVDVLAVARATAAHGGRRALVLGSRGFDASTPLRSRIGNTGSTALLALLTGRWIPDTQTGLRGITPDLLPWLLLLPGDRYEYEMRALMAASRDDGTAVTAVPVTTVYEDGNAVSHFRPLRDSLRVLRPVLLFAASSLAAAAADLGLFLLLFSLGLPAMPAVLAARVASGALNWTVNRHLVFADRETPWRRSALRYGALALGVGLLSGALTSGLLVVGLPAAGAKIAADVLCAGISFTVQRAFAGGGAARR